MNVSLTKLPWYAQLGAFLAMSLAALGAFYHYYATPVYAEMATRGQTLSKLRADIEKAQAIGRTLPQFEAQVKDLESRLEGLRPVLPETKDVAELLKRINALATQSNLRVLAFTPKPITPKQMHAEWPHVLQLEGTYHNLGVFFDKISKVSRIINISDLNIRSKDQPDSIATITAECTATTFVLVEAPPAAPAENGRRKAKK